MNLNFNGINQRLPARTKELPFQIINQGFGTLVSPNFSWYKNGNRLFVSGRATAGTTTASEGRFYFPITELVDAQLIQTLQVCGEMIISATGANVFYILCEPGVNYVTYGFQAGGAAALTKANGNSLSSSTVFSIKFDVPIFGWN